MQIMLAIVVARVDADVCVRVCIHICLLCVFKEKELRALGKVRGMTVKCVICMRARVCMHVSLDTCVRALISLAHQVEKIATTPKCHRQKLVENFCAFKRWLYKHTYKYIWHEEICALQQQQQIRKGLTWETSSQAHTQLCVQLHIKSIAAS